jgi:hypothetical protein
MIPVISLGCPSDAFKESLLLPANTHTTMPHRKALDTAISMKSAVTAWVDEGTITASVASAFAVYSRALMTKCEVLTIRAMRDSRPKKKHIDKYVKNFDAATKFSPAKPESLAVEWRTFMLRPLAVQVAELLEVAL